MASPFIQLLLVSIFIRLIYTSDFCPASLAANQPGTDVCSQNSAPKLQYLLYDVQKGEGFNLQRDVYMRMATLVYYLNGHYNLNTTLVLPFWGPMAHWKSDEKNVRLNWSMFFDIESLSQVVPVVELSDFLSKSNSTVDLVVSLSHFASSLEDEKNSHDTDASEKVKPFSANYRIEEECDESFNGEYFIDEESNGVSGWFWSLEDQVYASEIKCILLEGTSSTMADLIYDELLRYRSVLIADAQVVLHHQYGSKLFWQIRKSMVFSRQLTELADKFVSNNLSGPGEGEEDLGDENGCRDGYVAVHIRRSDFALYKKVPKLDCIAEQISAVVTSNFKMNLEGIKCVFVASDANDEEVGRLKLLLKQSGLFVVTYKNDSLCDGQVAIIEQIICSRGDYFIGEYNAW